MRRVWIVCGIAVVLGAAPGATAEASGRHVCKLPGERVVAHDAQLEVLAKGHRVRGCVLAMRKRFALPSGARSFLLAGLALAYQVDAPDPIGKGHIPDLQVALAPQPARSGYENPGGFSNVRLDSDGSAAFVVPISGNPLIEQLVVLTADGGVPGPVDAALRSGITAVELEGGLLRWRHDGVPRRLAVAPGKGICAPTAYLRRIVAASSEAVVLAPTGTGNSGEFACLVATGATMPVSYGPVGLWDGAEVAASVAGQFALVYAADGTDVEVVDIGTGLAAGPAFTAPAGAAGVLADGRVVFDVPPSAGSGPGTISLRSLDGTVTPLVQADDAWAEGSTLTYETGTSPPQTLTIPPAP